MTGEPVEQGGVIFASPTTPAHSLKPRFVVMITLVLSEPAKQVEEQRSARGAERQNCRVHPGSRYPNKLGDLRSGPTAPNLFLLEGFDQLDR